jgi:hypothetical protein
MVFTGVRHFKHCRAGAGGARSPPKSSVQRVRWPLCVPRPLLPWGTTPPRPTPLLPAAIMRSR